MWHNSPIRYLILCGVLLISAIVVSTAITVDSFRNRALVDSERELKNTALILAEQLDRSFQAVELVQSGVMEKIQSLGIASSEDYGRQMSGRDVHLMLKTSISGLVQVDAITLINADGKLLNFSRYWPIPEVNVADRDYFKVLKSDAQMTSFISRPERNRGNGAWTVFFARKVMASNGEFLGLVLGAVELSYFERFFGSIILGDGSSITLYRGDGILLTRYPRIESVIGKSFKTPVNALGDRDGGTARFIGEMEGKDRLLAAHRLAHYPLFISVAVDTGAALAGWQKEANILLGAGGLAGLTVAVMVLLVVRQLAQAHKLSTQRLTLEKQRLDTAVNNMSQGLIMFDSAERLVVCNDFYIEMHGLSRDIVKPGCSFLELLRHRAATGGFSQGDPEQYRVEVLAGLALGKITNLVVETAAGRAVLVTSSPMTPGGWVATHEDITERRRAEAKIAYMAHHDALTGLPNRLRLDEQLRQMLARSKRGEHFAVFCLDLDHFKDVNDALGHPVGDLLLKSVADRLRRCIRDTDTVARLGGDEFAVLQNIQGDQDDVAAVLAARIIEAVGEPFSLDGHQVIVGTSIGIALCPADGNEPDQLLKNADLALYRAKSEGPNTFRFFEQRMDSEARARYEIEVDLRRSTPSKDFEIYYQLLVDAHSQEVVGCEGLVRWLHPKHGLVAPDVFIPIAESTGLITALGEWVLRRACQDAVAWPPHIKVAINLSPIQFRNGNIVEIVASALLNSELAPERLELEITESVLLQKDESNLSKLHRLKSLGVSVVLDDFGLGYSSLSYLRTFPFDKVKIDRSFVAEISTRSDCAAVVCAITALAKSLDMATTAEGVETAEQFELLRVAGCNEMQGYLFGKPCPSISASI